MILNEALHVESLTDRERQMAYAVARGLRNRQIAVEYAAGISVSELARRFEVSRASILSIVKPAVEAA